MVTVVPGDKTHHWRAFAHGEPAGEIVAIVRPDRRHFLSLHDADSTAVAALIEAVTTQVQADVHIEINKTDHVLRRELERLGFAANRHDHHYLLPVDPHVTGLDAAALPDSFDIITAAETDPDRLMSLDEVLRQDVPGTDGWRNDPKDFRESTFGSTAFEPATYLVAVDKTTGEYVGLCRVWWNESGPRAGMVGVVKRCRQQGLARALVAQVWDVVWTRGHVAVSAEVDAANVASNALCSSIGGERVGGATEFVRLHASASSAADERS